MFKGIRLKGIDLINGQLSFDPNEEPLKVGDQIEIETGLNSTPNKKMYFIQMVDNLILGNQLDDNGKLIETDVYIAVNYSNIRSIKIIKRGT